MVWVCSHLGHLFKYTLNYYKKNLEHSICHLFEDKKENLFTIKLSKKKDSCYTESQNLINDQKQHQMLLIKKIIYLFDVCKCHFIFEMLCVSVSFELLLSITDLLLGFAEFIFVLQVIICKH